MFNSEFRRRSISAFAIAAILASAPMAYAAENCSALADDKARLACYDAANHKSDEPAPVETSANSRAIYGDYLRKFFLENGMNFEIAWLEKEDPKTVTLIRQPPSHFPQLLIFGYVSAPFVYQLITKGRVLDNARERGFKMVRFLSKGSEGSWYYDLSGPSTPQCDTSRRTCM